MILLIILLVAPTSLSAAPAFFQRHAEGWHWYELRSDSKNEKKKPPQTLSSLTPTQLIEAQRKALEAKLHKAIITPTHENVTTYIRAQRALMNQGQQFASRWKEVIMTTPSLDETFLNPIDQNARHLYYDLKNKERVRRIAALAREYGLFFFFKKDCPYCHGFAPLVKHFSAKYGWSVLAISLDGGTLPEFPKSRRDNGIARRLQVRHVPALLAIHPKNGQILPLAYGMISESEIEARIELLMRASSPPHEEGRRR